METTDGAVNRHDEFVVDDVTCEWLVELFNIEKLGRTEAVVDAVVALTLVVVNMIDDI
jgi:hypothetical protein